MYSLLFLYWSAYQADTPVTGVKGCTLALLALGDDAERAYVGRLNDGAAVCCDKLLVPDEVAAGDMIDYPLAVDAEQGCVRVHNVHKAQQREYNEYNEQQALIAITVCTSTLHECVG